MPRTVRLSPTYALCPRCEGRGTHVNPAIDGQGITGDEMAELGHQFFEDYQSGVYDVRCQECGGNRVVAACRSCGNSAVDEDGTTCYDHASPEVRDLIDEAVDYRREVAAEARWGY